MLNVSAAMRRFLDVLFTNNHNHDSDTIPVTQKDLIAVLVRRSLLRADTHQGLAPTANTNGTAAYAARLRNLLGELRADTLHMLVERDITPCLDQRLCYKNDGTIGPLVFAIYYHDHRVLALHDNGRMPSQRGFLDFNIGHDLNLYDAFEHLFDALKYGAPTHPMLIGTAENQRSCAQVFRWMTSDQMQRTLRKNPQLHSPPLRGLAPMAATP